MSLLGITQLERDTPEHLSDAVVPPPERPLLLLSLIRKGLKFSFSVASFLFLKLDNLVLLNVTPVLLGSFPPLLAL